MLKKMAAEIFGTFWLVFGGCGSAILSAAFPELGIGFVGVSLAFGIAVLAMVCAVGSISGGHFNPAVTFGLWVGGRVPTRNVVPYVVGQVSGAVAAAGILYLIASGKPGFEVGGFAANGYGDLSPGRYGLVPSLIVEFVATFFFLFIIMRVTHASAPAGWAPIAIGLTLTLIHLVAIPVTNTSVNPARSTGQAIFAGGAYIAQLWLFWLAPIAGGVLGGLAARAFGDKSI